jgi:hypothetical protein
MRCGTRDGRTLSRRRRLDPPLLVVRSRRATTEPWAARTGAKAARGALLSARCRALISRAEMLVAGAKQEPRESASGLLELLKGDASGNIGLRESIRETRKPKAP